MVTRDVSVSVEHRPAASNIGVSVSVGSLDVEGQPRRDGEGETPEIVSTKQQEGLDEGGYSLDESTHIDMAPPLIIIPAWHVISASIGPLLKVEFHLNPIDSKVDQKIWAKLQPVRVTYDAVSRSCSSQCVCSLAGIFMSPPVLSFSFMQDTIDAIIGMFLPPKDIHLQK